MIVSASFENIHRLTNALVTVLTVEDNVWEQWSINPL